MTYLTFMCVPTPIPHFFGPAIWFWLSVYQNYGKEDYILHSEAYPELILDHGPSQNKLKAPHSVAEESLAHVTRRDRVAKALSKLRVQRGLLERWTEWTNLVAPYQLAVKLEFDRLGVPTWLRNLMFIQGKFPEKPNNFYLHSPQVEQFFYLDPYYGDRAWVEENKALASSLLEHYQDSLKWVFAALGFYHETSTPSRFAARNLIPKLVALSLASCTANGVP